MALHIKLVRHGESEANVGLVQAHELGDHLVRLSPQGHTQARRVGEDLGAAFLQGALLYVSPYMRTRQTLEGLLAGAGLTGAAREALRVYEDPRLREVEHGYEPADEQQELRRRHGWFYYRFRGGESPADCFDRTCSFLESMMRQVERKAAQRVLIVTHGLTIRCFVMRFLHLTTEQFDELDSIRNCDVVTLGPRDELGPCQLTSGRWGVTGLRLRASEP